MPTYDQLSTATKAVKILIDNDEDLLDTIRMLCYYSDSETDTERSIRLLFEHQLNPLADKMGSGMAEYGDTYNLFILHYLAQVDWTYISRHYTPEGFVYGEGDEEEREEE